MFLLSVGSKQDETEDGAENTDHRAADHIFCGVIVQVHAKPRQKNRGREQKRSPKRIKEGCYGSDEKGAENMAAGKGVAFFAVGFGRFNFRICFVRPRGVVKMPKSRDRGKGYAADEDGFPYLWIF